VRRAQNLLERYAIQNTKRPNPVIVGLEVRSRAIEVMLLFVILASIDQKRDTIAPVINPLRCCAVVALPIWGVPVQILAFALRTLL